MKSRVSVTHIIGGGEFGGAEEHLLLLLEQLKKEGVQPHVVCFYDSLFAERLREREINVDVLAYGRFDFRLLFGLARLLTQKKPDIVHTHGVKANFFGRLAAKQTGISPIVTTVHSLLRYDYINPVARLLATLLDKSTRGLSHYYIAISEKIKSQLQAERIPASKIEVVHHGIDIHKFSPQADEKAAELALQWGKEESKSEESKLEKDESEEGKFLIGAISRLHPVKGFTYFIEACARLHQQAPDRFRFILVGDGPERQNLEKLVQQKGIADVFHFAGFRQDIPVCLKALDCYVSSSLSEGLGLSVLEALATGTPVVSTGVGGVLDFAKHEQNCLLVNPSNAEQLASSISRLVDDAGLAERLSKQAVQDIRSQFSVQQMGQKTAANYRKWLGRE